VGELDYNIVNYLLPSPAGTELEKGRYKLYVNAHDEKKLSLRRLDREHYFEVNYDIFNLDVAVSPGVNYTDKFVVTDNLATITIDAPKDIQLKQVFLSGIDITGHFDSEFQSSFITQLVQMWAN